jgi:hypothetical protein
MQGRIFQTVRTMGLLTGFLWVAWQAIAQEGTCARCGCCACLQRVCVAKPIEKEVVKVCWSVACEEVCIPGPSTPCGVQHERDKCGCWSYRLWKPSCARIKTRHVPVKTEVKRKVPAYEWVVEYRCANCCQAP